MTSEKSPPFSINDKHSILSALELGSRRILFRMSNRICNVNDTTTPYRSRCSTNPRRLQFWLYVFITDEVWCSPCNWSPVKINAVPPPCLIRTSIMVRPSVVNPHLLSLPEPAANSRLLMVVPWRPMSDFNGDLHTLRLPVTPSLDPCGRSTCHL
jgi:hypothetical protein